MEKVFVVTTEDGEGAVAFWDESAENYNRSYGIKADRTFAGVIKGGIPYAVNSNGQLLKFTGSGFDEVAVFPIYKQPGKRLASGSGAPINELIKKNGIAVIEEKIHILIHKKIPISATQIRKEILSNKNNITGFVVHVSV